MRLVKNILLADDIHDRPMLTDIHYDETAGPRPVIVYAHGFNGFKDWGGFDLVAKQFMEAGFTFIKFNFAYNGTTPEAPEEFVALEAYAENNYTKELDNLQTVIDWTCDPANPYAGYIDAKRLALYGHSRGGGIVLIKAAEEARVKAVATWASVSECKSPWSSWPAERIAAWKAAGIDHIENARTRQHMPLHYQLYEDYQQHAERLDIRRAMSSLHIPVLIVHGTADTSVPVAAAQRLKAWQPAAKLITLDADHTFGRRHPWSEELLRLPMQVVADETIAFFKQVLGGAGS